MRMEGRKNYGEQQRFRKEVATFTKFPGKENRKSHRRTLAHSVPKSEANLEVPAVALPLMTTGGWNLKGTISIHFPLFAKLNKLTFFIKHFAILK